MSHAVRVVVESPLLQLDREFDFMVPEALQDSIRFGQRVKFLFGRSKTVQTGFVTEVLNSSSHATSTILEIVDIQPVLTLEVLAFARAVADRQVVAIGEILALAIPDHMPRIPRQTTDSVPIRTLNAPTREVVLTDRQVEVRGAFFPNWMKIFLERANLNKTNGSSSLLIVPEASDVETLLALAQLLDIQVVAHETRVKSARFRQFHEILRQVKILVGTRSAIYAPVANLGLVAVADDADESYREVGSPHTQLRDLALLRAGEKSDLLFAAPYRSVELQRLVEIKYLKDITGSYRTVRMSYSRPGVRVDDATLTLAKEALAKGTLLILLPRKGSSGAAYCENCGDRLTCGCGGFVWEPAAGKFDCRLCGKPTVFCSSCKATSFRRGRSGSNRTTAELGKMFPGAQLFEATGDRKPNVTEKHNQIVVATPGSAPRLKIGYSGLVVLDTDVWLAAQHIRAEQNAVRDWFEATELLHPEARCIFAGLGEFLGKPLVLGQIRELAKAAYLDSRKLKLPPASRVATIAGTREQVSSALGAVSGLGAEVLRNDGVQATIGFEYSKGKQVAKELRSIATPAKAARRGSRNVRGFTIVMDSLEL
jgi:primosomal protein N' (replication factor Y)